MSPLPPTLASMHHALGIPPRYATDRQLEPQPEATEAELVAIGTTDEGRPIRVVHGVADQWIRLRDAAARDGITLLPISGFRSIERQAEIIRGKLTAGFPLEEILRYIAAPGFSEHHSGRAIDIGSPEYIGLDEEFARTAAFRWLERHAGAFGFHLSYPPDNHHGIGYEPWHWCWRPDSPGSA